VHARCSLDGTASQWRGTSAQRPYHVVGRELTEAVERAQGGSLHARIGIAQPASRHGRIAAVARQDEAAPPELGAAVTARIRGNIVTHPLEYVRP
jgi:hypothetical protein